MVRIVVGIELLLFGGLEKLLSGNWGLAKTSALFIQVTTVGGCLEMYRTLTHGFDGGKGKVVFFSDDNKGHQDTIKNRKWNLC